MNSVPFSIIFTKSDKLNESSLEKNINQYKNVLSEEWETLPQIFVTSSTKQTGKEQVLGFIDKVKKSYNDN
jgi:GTP-binding protein